MNAAATPHIEIRRRYLRSVDIPRDLDDPEALDGYILTPSARDATVRIVESLLPGSRQRAFRLAGAYGSGKSAFGLFLARLLQEQGNGPATALLGEACPQIRSLSTWRPVVLVGRRVSFTVELLAAVAAATSSLDISCSLAAKARSLLASETPPDPLHVTALLADVAADLRARTGAGLLVIVDEMGRFLEYASANSSVEDPSVFQHLAERSGGRAGADLAVVAILHQGFADYVAGLGSWIEAEWSRVASRYEEIRFDDSTEQSLFMLARALTHERVPVAVRHSAEQTFAQAVDRGLFAAERDDVVAIAAHLHPLHPAAITTIVCAARRFGQNERSLFSFLLSLEPDGFVRYLHDNPYDAEHWYRTANVFDHLAATIADSPTNARRERWSLALDALSVTVDMTAPHCDVLKTVALLAALEPVPGLVATPDTIAWCLGRSTGQVASLLDDLTMRRLIFFRPHRKDYSLWSNTSVDLAHWLDQARASVPRPRRLHDVAALPRTGRPVVAHRHYHATGTLRTFDVRLWTGEPPSPSDADGLILVVPLYSDRDRQDAVDALGDVLDDPLTITCFRRVPNSAIEWSYELALWSWLRENCAELRVDELARTEVAERIAAAETALLDMVGLLASPDAGEPDTWMAGGRTLDVPAHGLSAVVSATCEQVYDRTPVLRNELLNRHKLTSAAASARMRLLEAMVANAAQDRLGIRGTPPEFAMYLSLLGDPGIHRSNADGEFAFHAPTNERWQPAWQHIADRLAEDDAVPFDTLMDELGKPPFGIRAGPALPLLAAYVLSVGDQIAVLERGTFVPDLTVPHFMRLAKAPRNFALRSLRESTDQTGLLSALATGLDVIHGCQPTVPAIAAALYHWFNRLPPYALRTEEVSPVAATVRHQLRRETDPAELLFRHLTVACSPPATAREQPSADTQSSTAVLNAALRELDQALPRLRLRAIEAVVHAFEAGDLASLRHDLRRDFAPHRHHLQDHRLAVFVDRAIRQDVDDDVWLDGVAGHVVGKRPGNWADGTIDQFDLDVRIIAANLAKWLTLAQSVRGSGAGLRSVHLVDIDGRDRVVVLRGQPNDPALSARVDAIRELLGEDAQVPHILGHLLEEFIDRHENPDTEERQ